MPFPDLQSLLSAALVLSTIAGTFLLAGLVKGVVGLGLPTVVLGLLGAIMTPAQAAALLIVPSLVTNLWQMFRGSALAVLVRRLWGLLAGVFAGTILGPLSIATLDVRIASAALGSALILYAGLGFVSVRFAVARHLQPWISPIVGLLTGAAAAATGVFVFPMVPYLQGMGLRRDELVQALGLCFTVATIALGWRLVADGAIGPGRFTIGANVVVPLAASLIGMALGQSLRGRLNETAFRRVFLFGLFAVGVHLIAKGLIG